MNSKTIIVICLISLILMSSYIAWYSINLNKKAVFSSRELKENINEIIYVSKIIYELQKERGLSTIYYKLKNQKQISLLNQQRAKTILQISKRIPYTKEFSNLSKNIKFIQQKIKSHTYSDNDIFTNYTNIINKLFIKLQNLIFETNNMKIKNELIFYENLTLAEESLGQQRAILGKSIFLKKLNDDNYHKILYLNTKFKDHINMIKLYAKQVYNYKQFDKSIKSVCLKKTINIIEHISKKQITQNTNLNSIQWFNLSTCGIDELYDYSNLYIENIKNIAIKTHNKAINNLLAYSIFWLIALLILIVLFLVTSRRSKELGNTRKILEKYKEAIDYSTIVSKTDKAGIITYVNDSFLKISGYTREELLGKPHNIVRHPDVPKEVFKELWLNLKSGKRWNGIIKNLKKDGNPYWVDAYIAPIHDHKGKLIEYIAMRHDITNIVSLNNEIKHTQKELIYKIGEAVESRSKETGNHVRRVAYYSKLLATLANLNKEDCQTIFTASTMHDIGKISIPDSILLKKGKLTNKEWEIMRTHSEVGYKILKGSSLTLIKIAADIAYEHHEHYNGKGYPLGIKGEQISIYGRIVAIVDVFDALATKRVYKDPWKMEDILVLLKEKSGKQFDPNLIKIFLDNLNEFLKIKDQFKD